MYYSSSNKHDSNELNFIYCISVIMCQHCVNLRTFIVVKLLELTILVVNISISRKKDMLTVVFRGSFFKELDNKIKGFVHI